MPEPVDLIAPEAFTTALAGARQPIVVDVRAAALYELGHVPGSLNIPVHDLGRRRPELPGSLIERILLVGDHRERTIAAGRFLRLVGFGDIAVLAGGIAAYTGPLETGPPPPPRGAGPELRITK